MGLKDGGAEWNISHLSFSAPRVEMAAGGLGELGFLRLSSVLR